MSTTNGVKFAYVGKKQNIFSLPRPQEGELFHAADTNETYVYHDGQFSLIKIDPETGFQMGLYEMNKQIINQLPDLTELDVAEKVELINNFFTGAHESEYVMLLGKEISYYTIFHRNPDMVETLGEAALECLNNIGMIKAIDTTEDLTAIECWVVPVDSDEPTCLYMFTYDIGVVEVQ